MEETDEELTGYNRWLRAQAIETRKSGKGAPRSRGQATSYTDEATKGLVVAYWSYDYRDHAMGHLTRGLFCSHQVRVNLLVLADPDGEATVNQTFEFE